MGGKYMKKASNVMKTFAIPVLTAVLLVIVCELNGIHLISSRGHWLTLVRSTVVITLTSWALSLNLNSGRFDFSIGSIAILSSMISAKIVTLNNLSPISLLLLSATVGLILGAISGVLYVTLKLPPIITSLGVTLIYEAFTFVVTNGEGILISTHLELLKLSSLSWLIWIGIIGFVTIYFIFNFIKYGYDYSALKNGQHIANQTGINEAKNAVIGYAISGTLMGVVGSINITTRGSASVALNFSSISTMFIAFLPLFIGGFIGRFSEERFGILLGSLTTSLITLGFVRLDVASQMQSLINALILVLFIIYLNNEKKFLQLILGRKL